MASKNINLDGLFGLDGYVEETSTNNAKKVAPKKTTQVEKEKVAKEDKKEDKVDFKKQPDDITKGIEDARQEYNRATHGGASVVKKAISILLGAATAGLVGVDYAMKANAYSDAMYAAEYNAKLAELQNQAVEALHQSALSLGNAGHPVFDNNDASIVFPNMDGSFSKFAQENPEIARNICDRVVENMSGQNDVLNQYATERGFENWDAFSEWTNSAFSHLFNADGTVSALANMNQLQQYYTIMADAYNYVGQEAMNYYAEDMLAAGIDQSKLDGIQFVSDAVTDEAGNVIGHIWSTEIIPGAINVDTTGWDAGQIVGAAAVAAIAGVGVYLISDKIISHFSNNSTDEATETMETSSTR